MRLRCERRQCEARPQSLCTAKTGTVTDCALCAFVRVYMLINKQSWRSPSISQAPTLRFHCEMLAIETANISHADS